MALDFKASKGLLNLAQAMAEGAFDLHLHSYCSDGTQTPAEVLQEALERHLSLIALTDHDTMEGVETIFEVQQKLKKCGVDVPTIIPGVEISSAFTLSEEEKKTHPKGEKGWIEVHILAYYPDYEYAGIEDFLDVQQMTRDKRNHELCERLVDLGYDISHDELRKKFPHGILGRPHIAQILVEKDYFASIGQAFDVLLGEGKPGYLPRELPPSEAVLERIVQSGGIPVLAHPYHYDWLEPEDIRRHLRYFMDHGLLGVELIHGETPMDYSKVLAKVIEPLDLLPTAGSDAHGTHKPGIKMFSSSDDFSLHSKALQHWLKTFGPKDAS